MGIMTRLLHRSGGLSENPYKQFFLDMGENIHIHYRDLRIELSVPEFLEFSEMFERCAPSVKSKIDGGYKDGVLPNTNESNTLTTISLNAPLQHPVKYNANRISIEENFDGYHIHFRNYKLLFDKKSFDNILQAMNDVVERRNSQRTLDELLHLIVYNDLEYRLIEVNRDTDTKFGLIEVEKKYFGKLRQIFKALKYSYTEEAGGGVFSGENMKIRAKIGIGKVTSILPVISPPPYVLLIDYLTARKGQISPSELNLIKLQVLNSFGMVRAGENLYINLDFHSFLVNPINQTVVFQTTSFRHIGDSIQEYEAFSSFLYSLGQHFMKPAKIIFSEIENKKITDIFQSHVAENIASHPCVSKIYMLGSSMRNNMGKYEVPFIHFDWAKLASDFDILIEIDEKYAIPEQWERKFFWKKAGSYYSHLGDVQHQIDSPYLEQYKYVKFFHHLIEAYLFFPSSGDAQAKDNLLADFKAELIYTKKNSKKRDPINKISKTFNWINGVIQLMRDAYNIATPVVSEITVPSHNKLFKVTASDAAYVVKIYNSSNFTPAKVGSNAAHIDYEIAILNRLEQCDVPVIPVCRNIINVSIQEVGGLKAVVFRYIDGQTFDNGLEQVVCSAGILAKVHQYLPIDAILLKDFDYSTSINYWLTRLDALSLEQGFASCVSNIADFMEFGRRMRSWFDQELLCKDMVWVHGHGDVNPRNYIYVDNSAFLFDFQAARLMPRLGDIADGIIEFGISGDVIVAGRIESFLRGYEAMYPLTDIERKQLNSFLLASCMIKMLIMIQNDIHYGYKINSQRMNALLNYCTKLTMEIN